MLTHEPLLRSSSIPFILLSCRESVQSPAHYFQTVGASSVSTVSLSCARAKSGRPEHLEQRAEEMDYIMRLARLRSRALKYLLYATMLRPPDVAVPEEEIDISRQSIYAGQQEALKQYRKTCPSVLSSAWQAPDGDVAMVVVNMTEKPQHFSMTLDRSVYAIPDGSCVSILDDTGRRPAEQASPAAGQVIELQVDLPPADARIYEFNKR